MKYHKTRLSILMTIAIALTGCGGSSSSNTSDQDSASDQDSTSDSGENTIDSTNYVTLDATDASAPAYLDLNSGHAVNADESWHLAYQKYIGFTTNSEGAVSACIAKEYTELYDENGDAIKSEFSALTKDNTLSDYNNVTLGDCSDFTSDAVESQFAGWYTYNSTTHAVTVNSDDTNGWIIKSSTDDGNGNFAYTRLKATAYDANGITFNSELWDNNSQTFNAAESTGVLSSASDTIYWNMEDNSQSTTEFEGWDLKIEPSGHSSIILVNGGASGSGSAGVGSALLVENVDAVTDPTSTQQVYKYFGDSASGPLSSPGSFGPLEYGVGGDNHDMWPTFATYIFNDGQRYFKAQVVSNTGEDGTQTSGTLYIRYQEITE